MFIPLDREGPSIQRVWCLGGASLTSHSVPGWASCRLGPGLVHGFSGRSHGQTLGQPGGNQLSTAPHVVERLKCGGTYFNPTAVNSPFKAIVGRNSPRRQELNVHSQCSNMPGRTSGGMFDPDGALVGKCSPSLPVNESASEQTLADNLCAPTPLFSSVPMKISLGLSIV